jgi:hypothetical protein
MGIVSLIFFFVIGLVLLPLVNVPRAMAQREGKQVVKSTG